jgi:hypothetical protein
VKPGNQAPAMVLNPARTFLIDERKAEASALSSERAFLFARPSQDRYCVKFIIKGEIVYEKVVFSLAGSVQHRVSRCRLRLPSIKCHGFPIVHRNYDNRIICP